MTIETTSFIKKVGKHDIEIDITFDFNPSFVIPGKIHLAPEDCYPDETVDMEYDIIKMEILYPAGCIADKEMKIIFIGEQIKQALILNPDLTKTIEEEIIEFDSNYVPEPE